MMNLLREKIHIIYIICSLAFVACSHKPENVRTMDCPPPIFPDYVGVTIPAGIAPMNFNVMGETERVDVVVEGSKGGEMQTNGRWARFDEKEWHELVARNIGGELTFSVCARQNGQWRKFQSFKMMVSEHPLDDWGLTYRRIAPGYEVYSRMGIYQRDLSSFEESVIMDNSETAGLCYNCHTSNRTNPQQLVFHVRGDHGATMCSQDGETEWLKAVNDSLGGAMVYPYWHPSGRFVAFSTNMTRQAFHVVPDEHIEVFDFSSDVLIYNPTTHEILLDPRLSQKDWSENVPVFSPDGRSLYFITTPQPSYPSGFKDVRYNLCRVAFDPEDMTFGAEVDTIFNAEKLGKSVTWPRPSYDGRFLLFTLIDYGYFSIWHNEAEQWIMNLETGETRALTTANSDRADSYHNWSSDSRWIVFTSRRHDGLYSQLFLSSIDENGNETKPFLLPQENPWEYYDGTLYSFNTPDFTSEKVSFDRKSAAKEILSDKRIGTKVRR